MVRAAVAMRPALDLVKRWDWGLYSLIFLYMAMPQFYRSYSVYLIGNAIPAPTPLRP